MDLKPFGDRIIVSLIDSDAVTTMGIIIPDIAKAKSDKAVVVAAGPGKKSKDGTRLALSVKKDDTILFVKGTGIRVNHKGQDYLVLSEDDVYGILDR